MIRFNHVVFRYTPDTPRVIDDITVTIDKGESVCVMGANGSGKSTFARLIAGLLQPVRGTVDVNGNIPAHEVGILFQNPDNQIVAVTVEKEIAFALENRGVPYEEMEERITRTLKRFSITHLRQRLTSELSGGEKQRVALAAIMVAEPSILVLDEPGSFLDESGKQALYAELDKLREQNPHMIQVHITQYPATARRYRRMLVFEKGRIVADASPEDIFAETSFCMRTALAVHWDEKKFPEFPDVHNNINEQQTPLLSQIRMEKLSFQFPGMNEAILHDITTTIAAGATLGIAGSSGSGKSTLALLLCGLLQPSSGEIIYYAADTTIIPREEITGQVAVILQQPERQFFLPTCAEEVAFGPQNLKRTLTQSQVARMLDAVGLEPEDFASKDPFRLSGGEKRRLAFAAVLSMMPRIVVFDEPTCSLDQEGVGRFIALIRALQKRDVGIVIISHDGDILNVLTETILLLDTRRGSQMIPTRDFFANAQFAGIVSPLTWDTIP